MKLLVVSTVYPPLRVGGAEVAASRLAEALARRGHEVTVACLDPEGQETTEIRNGVRVYRVPLENIYWPFGDAPRRSAAVRLIWHWKDRSNRRAARRFAKIIDAERPDVIHTHNVTGFSVSVWKEAEKRGIPIVHTVHDYYLLCRNSKLFREGKTCEHRCSSCVRFTQRRRSASAAVDAVVGVSDFVLRKHQREGYFINADAQVIYNIAEAPTQGKTAARRRSDDALIFGYIGRLSQNKGIEILLRASQRLKHARWMLRVAGSGEPSYVEKLKLEYPDPRIEWLGYMDTKAFYDSVDMVVVPSIWPEPAPYVCIESILAGNSLICSDSGGIPELASLAPMAAVLRAGDCDGLTRSLDDALDEPQRWRRGISQPLRVFDEEQVVERYLDIYRSVLCGHGARVYRGKFSAGTGQQIPLGESGQRPQ